MSTHSRRSMLFKATAFLIAGGKLRFANPETCEGTEGTLRRVTLPLLDALASRSTDFATTEEFANALLNYIGADEMEGGLRSSLHQALLTGEMARPIDGVPLMGPEEFLASIQRVIDGLQLQAVFSLSESDLSLIRKALTRIMPHFFSDPAIRSGLRSAERLYLMYLIWTSGTLAKEEGLPASHVPYTTATFTNGRRSQYIALRNRRLGQISEADLRSAFHQLASVVRQTDVHL